MDDSSAPPNQASAAAGTGSNPLDLFPSEDGAVEYFPREAPESAQRNAAAAAPNAMPRATVFVIQHPPGTERARATAYAAARADRRPAPPRARPSPWPTIAAGVRRASVRTLALLTTTWHTLGTGGRAAGAAAIRFGAERVGPAVRTTAASVIRWTRSAISPLARSTSRWVVGRTLPAVRSDVRQLKGPVLLPARLAALSAVVLAVALAMAPLGVGRRAAPAPVIAAESAPAPAPPGALVAASTAVLVPLLAPVETPRLGNDLIPTPSAPSAPAPARTAARPASRSVSAQIQRALNQYRDGFSTLDVAAVKVVWPDADEAAMRRQFSALYDQNVQFDACSISTTDQHATAFCRGSISAIAGGRNGVRRTQAREWRFTLRDARGRWLIASVSEGSPGRVAGRAY